MASIAEGVVGRAEIVVDRLRHPHDPHPLIAQLGGGAEGVLAPDHDQAVDLGLPQVLLNPLHPAVLLLERVGPGGAEDRSSAGKDPADLRDPKRPGLRLERPAPAIAVADELVAVFGDPLADDRADHGIQAGAVAPAGEHPDSHVRVW
jgi:hypothetical protein